MPKPNNKGQIVVEYLLLMVIAIGCAAIITKQLINRDENKPGVLIKQWDKIIHTIGNDVPDCSKQADFSKANCPP